MTMPVNYDEGRVGRITLPELMTGPGGKPVESAGDRDACQIHLRRTFAKILYGTMPPPPDGLSVERIPLSSGVPGTVAEQWRIALTVGGRNLERPAVFWRPAKLDGPLPVICGLGFLGAAGVTPNKAVDLDETAHIDGFADAGVVEGRPTEAIRGVHKDRWPVDMITGAGFGLLVSGYGGWVPDHPDLWKKTGLWPLLQPMDAASPPGAIGLWAWALRRLIDALRGRPDIDGNRIYAAGHSRLGKAALWAAANDVRVAGALINNAGCGGTSLSRRNYGETLAHMTARFPHWLTPAAADLAARPETLPVDQHQLLACLAPRRLYVASASEDRWADPRGEYLALREAAPFWSFEDPGAKPPPAESVFHPGKAVDCGPLAWHLREGGHDLTRRDWRHFLNWLSPSKRP
ncbi:MAG: hypothetical protein MI741_05490 [Rhodospirillales bacterium]|nr:hypothetical protein [Rhodospirillales bacterium]